jgi:hypothetical protein
MRGRKVVQLDDPDGKIKTGESINYPNSFRFGEEFACVLDVPKFKVRVVQ